jgi:hypothetical protein
LDNNSKYEGGEKLSKGEAFPTWSSSSTPGMEIEVHGQVINPHMIELLQQIGQSTPNTNGRLGRAIGPPL